jgi:ligand-binding SRPBCC domain-containing protein
MPVIELSTRVHAPLQRCFDLSRSIDLHARSTAGTEEVPVAGVTSGLIGAGEEVTWRARHLGVRQHLTSRITSFEPPGHFRDSMVRGAFRRFDHDHYFEPDGEFTIMRDRFDYTSPFGLLGRLADALFLKRYMTRFLEERNRVIREVAESEGWREYIAEVSGQ